MSGSLQRPAAHTIQQAGRRAFHSGAGAQRLPSHSPSAALQEGAGNAVVSAYVEVILDNRDRRAPVSPTELPCAGLAGGLLVLALLPCKVHRTPHALDGRACRRDAHLLPSSLRPMSLLSYHLMLQVDKDEFRIRRTFGAKKDEYHVDRKSTTWVWAATC